MSNLVVFDFIKNINSIKNAYLNSIDISENLILLPLSHKIYNSLLNRYKKEFAKDINLIDSKYESKFNSDKLSFINQGFSYVVLDNLDKYYGIIFFKKLDDQFKEIELNFSFTCEKEEIILETIKEAIISISKTLIVDKLIIDCFKTDFGESLFAEIGFVPYKEDSKNKFLIFKDVYVPKKGEIILTAGPSVSSLEASYAYDAAINGWNNNWAKYIRALEKKFADFLGVNYAISTSSCTGALQIALEALDIGDGDEVIVPDQTWVATANAVKYAGAKPVFADVEMTSWNICPNSVRKLINERTKAIIPVHMYGNPCNMDEIMKIASDFNLRIVEDAAPSIGASWKGRKTGTFGDFGGFSFQGAKLMVTGEGGMLVTNNLSLYEKAKKIADQGRNSNAKRSFWIDEKGLKYKMSNLQASFGLAQLERIDTLISMKRRIFKWYKRNLSGLNCIKIHQEHSQAKSIYWMSSICLQNNSNISRDRLIALLKEDGIDTRPTFPAISQYPIWGKNRNEKPAPNANYIAENGINLPSGVCLTESKINYVCEKIKYHLQGSIT